MNEYDIEIKETLMRTVTVQAQSRIDAINWVADMYNCGAIVLTADDFADVEFFCNE